jgi:FAD/FMN-containing dehydrogenase
MPRSVQAPAAAADLALGPGAWLACGNLRSYGDSCLPGPGAGLIDMRAMKRVVSFDPETGVIRAEAGLTIDELLAHVGSHGWFPAVVPGTRFVTLGGAVANDIHGKNHHRRGTFGCHVRSLRISRSTGETADCGPDLNSGMFAATVGGLGLTGVITEVELQLMRVPSPDIVQRAFALDSLSDFFRMAPECESRFEYAVAWIDSLGAGAKLGRGVLLCGEHADAAARSSAARQRAVVPFTPPVSLIGASTLKAFNALYRWRALAKQGPHRVSRNAFFFPLDAIGHWNRLYGPKGLRQHQSVIPLARAEAVIAGMLTAAQRAGHGSFLTVLKLFGDKSAPGMMSFATPGATLTLDFPYRGASTDALLADLDARVLVAGGRVNPYKDARMDAETFRASFPDMERFRAFIDPRACSGFSDRVGLTIGSGVRDTAA